MSLSTETPVSRLAGLPATREMLVDIGKLEREYYECRPDPATRANW